MNAPHTGYKVTGSSFEDLALKLSRHLNSNGHRMTYGDARVWLEEVLAKRMQEGGHAHKYKDTDKPIQKLPAGCSHCGKNRKAKKL